MLCGPRAGSCCDPRLALDVVQCNQACLGAAMIFLASEQGVCGREQLDSALTGVLLVLTGQPKMFLPGRRLDDLDWYRTQRDGCFERAGCATVLEPAGSTLVWHGLRAFD